MGLKKVAANPAQVERAQFAVGRLEGFAHSLGYDQRAWFGEQLAIIRHVIYPQLDPVQFDDIEPEQPAKPQSTQSPQEEGELERQKPPAADADCWQPNGTGFNIASASERSIEPLRPADQPE